MDDTPQVQNLLPDDPKLGGFAHCGLESSQNDGHGPADDCFWMLMPQAGDADAAASSWSCKIINVTFKAPGAVPLVGKLSCFF